MENEPGIIVNFGEREFEATPENTTLFRFVGKLALYNHIFMLTVPEENIGAYLFNQHPVYKEFEDYMVKNQYPIHDNLREVAECDLDAFENMLRENAADIGDYPPEDWS